MTTRSRRFGRFIFNLSFWTPFWLLPWIVAVIRLHSVWIAEGSDPFVFTLARIMAGVAITAGLAALAELCGAHRRYFYLIMGTVCCIGAQIWLAFLFLSFELVNPYTVATAAEYLVRDGSGLSYVIISPWLALPLIAVMLPFVLLAWTWNRLDWPVSRRFAACGAAAALSLIPINIVHNYWIGDAVVSKNAGDPRPFYRADDFVPFESFYKFSQYLALRRELAGYESQYPLTSRTPQPPLTLIVLIGESTPRGHMGIYGYCRDTTPELAALRDQLFVFDNAMSNFPLTIFALQRVLRLPSVPTRSGPAASTLFTLMNRSGFDTYLLSNQYRYIGGGDVLSTLMSAAHHQVWAVTYGKNSSTVASTDEVLLPYLRQALAAPGRDKAIFLHLIGTHYTYTDRYPANFPVPAWPPLKGARPPATRATIDIFDNAVRYQDKQIAAAITAARQAGGNVALVYFSDHGEEVADQYASIAGHFFPGSTRSMVEIPFLAWLSPALRQSRPQLVNALAAARHEPLQLGDIAPFLFDIAGIRPAKDTLPHPLAPGFKGEPRLVLHSDYDRDPNLGHRPELPPLCPASAH